MGVELLEFLTGGINQRIDILRLADEGNGTAREIGRIASAGHRGADAIDLAHLLTETLQQCRAQNRLQGRGIHFLNLQIAIGLILLPDQRHRSFLLVAGGADEFNVTMGNLTVADQPRRVGLATGQSANIGTDVGTHVAKVTVTKDDEGISRGWSIEAVVQRQHVIYTHITVDERISEHGIGIVAPAHQPIQLTAEAFLGRLLLQTVVLLYLIECHAAYAGVETRLGPS